MIQSNFICFCCCEKKIKFYLQSIILDNYMYPQRLKQHGHRYRCKTSNLDHWFYSNMNKHSNSAMRDKGLHVLSHIFRRTSVVNFHFVQYILFTTIGPQREKTCLRWSANNTGADQPAHPRSLISAFVIRVLKSTISKLATSEISFF